MSVEEEREKANAASDWTGMFWIPESTKREIDKAYEQFWNKNQIKENIGTRTNPIFIRTNYPRVRPNRGSVIDF